MGATRGDNDQPLQNPEGVQLYRCLSIRQCIEPRQGSNSKLIHTPRISYGAIHIRPFQGREKGVWGMRYGV